MTSTASKPKNYTSLAFKKTFKSTLVNAILALGASVVVVLIAISSTILQNFYDGTSNSFGGDYDVTDLALTATIFLTIITGFFSLTVAPRMFKQIYKKQSCDSYFSVPIKREEYFVANYFYGVLINVLCYVISFAIFIPATLIASNKYITYVIDYKTLVPVVIAMMLAVIAIYSAFIMCAVISGKRIQYLVLSLICLVCTSTTFGGIILKINSIWGLSADLTALSAVSPVENAVAAYINGISVLSSFGSSMSVLIIISLVEIIGMFFAGYIAFKNRKAETAEMSLSGKILPYVILAVLSSAAFFFSATGNSVIDIVIGLVLAVLITMAFTAIFYKKPFTKETAVTVACVCGVCTFLSIGVMLPIFDGYVKYVPNSDEVESAKLVSLDSDEGYAGITSILNSDYTYIEDFESVTLSEKENIEKVIALHNKSVDDTVIKAARKNNSSSWLRLMLFIDSVYSGDYQTDVFYKISYKLTDGSTVERVYSVPNTLISKEYFDIVQTEEALRQLEPMCIDNDRLLAVECFKNYEEDYEYFNESVELVNFDLEKFNEALIQDYLSMERSSFIREFDSFQSIFFDIAYYDPEEYYSEDYYYNESMYDLEIYYASDDITDEELEKYKNMSVSQLLNAIYEDWEGNMSIDNTYVCITENYVNALEYLNSCGANLK